ncbi:MAG: protein kinase domain-containing protein [Actinomycetota bacterium]
MVEIKGFNDLAVIGRGGFSTVYRAHQTAQARDVAVKVLDVGSLDDAQRTRFERECAAMGRLGSHPSVMTVYESGYTVDGKPYIAMELCEGGSLADRVAELGSLPLEEALHSAIRIAGAVETAHRSGITHRDIKPENMLVTSYGEVVLSDFGISALDPVRAGTATGSSFTLMHVAPEVLEGKPAEAPADIYSLGSSLYRLVTGGAPYADDSTPLAIAVSRIMNDPVPESAEVPKSLNKALAKAMAKSPSARYSSALAFAEALRDVQKELGFSQTEAIVGSSPASSGGTRSSASENSTTTELAQTASAAPKASTTGPRLPKVDVPVVAKTPTWKKFASTAAVLAVLLGGGAFAFTQLSGGDSGDENAESAATSAAGDSSTSSLVDPSSTLVAQTFPPVASPPTAAPTTVPPPPSATTAAPSAPPPSVTAASSTTFPFLVPDLSLFIPPSSFISIAPGVLDAFTCLSFSVCAQKLFDAWKANSKATAAYYATPAAVDSLFAFSFAPVSVGWNSTVTKQGSDYVYAATSTRIALPKKVTFFFVAGQTGFKVQTVVVS